MWLHKTFEWISERLKDVFYDSNNGHLDNGRCLAYIFAALLVVAVRHNMLLKLEIPLDKLGEGMAAILSALVIYVYHDRRTNGS